MASSPVYPSSPTGTLKRDASKKDSGKLGWVGTLTRRKKGQEVDELETEGRHAIESPTTPITVTPDTFDLDENEERSMVEPASLENIKLKELKEVLLDWINDELSEQRIVLRDITEDLYDGQILAVLMDKLAGIKLSEFEEVTQSVESQKAKLSILLEHVNKLLGVPQHRAKWSANGKFVKIMKSICLALLSGREIGCGECATPSLKPEFLFIFLLKCFFFFFLSFFSVQNGKPERDAFDALFDNAPEKLNVVKKSLQVFVNKHLAKLSLEVVDIDSQFHDGVYLIFLLGLLEGFFVPLYQFYITPATKDQKLHNVTLAIDLMRDSGLKFYAKPEDVVHKDLKSTLRILYCLFQKYKSLK
ncbi:beta-parvin-like [Pocillopora damicornis]|uniref:beta-parvin-like n=1 Tax=Pocillopora damicornis TaxID=46731 RepID=UPI000F553D65|nr:beta-parvin-like [Pocillopora damicornis]